MRHATSPAAWPLVALFLAVTSLSGCQQQKIEFREVIRVDERLSQVDLDRLYRIAKVMPKGRLPVMADHFLAPPRWDPERTATVTTLAKEELARLREVIQLSVMSDSVSGNSRLVYALKQEGMTRDQFAGLVLSVGLAIHRSLLDPARNLETYVEVGRHEMRKLTTYRESFATLTPVTQVDRMEQATWITRVNRAERLLEVPQENVHLVNREYDRLQKIMPKQFLIDPLAGLNDPLIDHGVPFREIAKTGFDAEIHWDVDDANAVINGRSRTRDEPKTWANSEGGNRTPDDEQTALGTNRASSL